MGEEDFVAPDEKKKQAIGGVNEKIEGFFEVCMAKGLTGVEAGQRLKVGGYGAGTVFGKVDRRLRQLAKTLVDFGKDNHKTRPKDA